MMLGERVDDYGDDYGLRVERIPSSTVIVARYRPPDGDQRVEKQPGIVVGTP
jgi:hypothetical protein